ncbi:MAG: HlyD family efflux transporter periplasmic adaptor subunit [Novosphingobium sp.]|nr:HlyD family efflux transporter periplasmic adaptor subunit [Novosphingobium sp.]
MNHRALLPLLLLLTAALSGCSGSEENSHVGYVEAEWVYVAAPQSGWIVSRPAGEGNKVAAGDILFTLDSERQEAASAAAGSRVEQAQAEARDIAKGARAPEIRALEAQLKEAQAGLTLARADQNRILSLVEEGIESRQRGDQAKANFATAQARVASAQEQIRIARLAARAGRREAAAANVAGARAARNSASYDLRQRTIRAQLAGNVSETFLEPGEFAPAGSPVLALLPKDGLKVRFFVGQQGLPNYAIGGKVSVSADGLADPVTGTISFIASEAEFTPPVIYSEGSRDKLVFLVEARLPAGSKLRPGLPVDVTRK